MKNKGLKVRMEGLEPPRLAAPDPKSGTATNYATSACDKVKSEEVVVPDRSLPRCAGKYQLRHPRVP
jgi:hypothetical protein